MFQSHHQLIRKWEALIRLDDFDFTVLVHVQASLLPSAADCLIIPSHESTVVIADNTSLLMFFADFINCLLHSLIL